MKRVKRILQKIKLLFTEDTTKPTPQIPDDLEILCVLYSILRSVRYSPHEKDCIEELIRRIEAGE